MNIHIGQKIQEVLKERGMTISEFARRIHTSRQNVYGIFKRESIDTGLLRKISSSLDHDFFVYYGTVTAENKQEYRLRNASKHSGKNKNSFVQEIEILRKENIYLKEINDLLREKLRSLKALH